MTNWVMINNEVFKQIEEDVFFTFLKESCWQRHEKSAKEEVLGQCVDGVGTGRHDGLKK